MREDKLYIDGLGENSISDLLFIVKNHLNKRLENFVEDDFKITNIGLFGSRVNGFSREDSDLDVVFEYEGNMREDDVFNALCDDPLFLADVQLDFSPY